MKLADIFGLFGGLALFLYGMQMTSSGLEIAAGSKMKKILETLTKNRFLGVLVGAVVTALVQSSSAVTVMVVGFVNSGLMTLNQAIWIIMGANIGTTTTGLLIALDVGEMAPLFAFIGVVMIMFFKKPKYQHYGQIIAGLGILFIGMETMSGSMHPLREMPEFINLMAKFSNPILGIMTGAIFTAVVQASAASVGILQSLAMGGIINLGGAVFVLFGQNIGTCITSLLASVGMSRNAKRATLMHFMFNFIGTAVFTLLCLTTPLVGAIESLVPTNVAGQIATMHVIFNIATTILLLPFGQLLVKAAQIILPGTEGEESEEHHLMYIKKIPDVEYHLGAAAIAVGGVKHEVARMMDMVFENTLLSYDVMLGEYENFDDVNSREEYIDYLNKEIIKYISDSAVFTGTDTDSDSMTKYFGITGNIERIGDHAQNITEYKQRLVELGLNFSEDARADIFKMREVTEMILGRIIHLDEIDDAVLSEVSDLENEMDDLTDQFRAAQMERLQRGECSGEACVLFSELLTDFERIGDHALNIAEALANKTILTHE